MKLSISTQFFLVSFFVYPLVLQVDKANGCLAATNITLDQLFEGNEHLKAFHELEPRGFLSTEGLKRLVTTLVLRTACPPLREEVDRNHEEELHGHELEEEHFDHDHQHDPEVLEEREKMMEKESVHKNHAEATDSVESKCLEIFEEIQVF